MIVYVRIGVVIALLGGLAVGLASVPHRVEMPRAAQGPGAR